MYNLKRLCVPCRVQYTEHWLLVPRSEGVRTERGGGGKIIFECGGRLLISLLGTPGKLPGLPKEDPGCERKQVGRWKAERSKKLAEILSFSRIMRRIRTLVQQSRYCACSCATRLRVKEPFGSPPGWFFAFEICTGETRWEVGESSIAFVSACKANVVRILALLEVTLCFLHEPNNTPARSHGLTRASDTQVTGTVGSSRTFAVALSVAHHILG